VLTALVPGKQFGRGVYFVSSVYLASVQVAMIYFNGLPHFLESVCYVFLLCCALVPILKEIFVIISVSWVAWFTDARAARTRHAARDEGGDLPVARNAASNDRYGLVFSVDYL